jgi:hypothetical protein
VQTFASSRPRTVDEGVEDELSVLLDEVIDVSENSTHYGCERMWWVAERRARAMGEKIKDKRNQYLRVVTVNLIEDKCRYEGCALTKPWFCVVSLLNRLVSA